MKDAVESTEGFEKFLKSHPDAYAGIGFFIWDYEDSTKNVENLDYYIPSNGKIASFDIEGNNKISEQVVEKVVEPLGEVLMDTDQVRELVKAELNKREILFGIQKIIAVLQRKDLEVSWNLSCILTNTDFAKIRIRDADSFVTKFEIINLMSLISLGKKPDFIDNSSAKSPKGEGSDDVANKEGNLKSKGESNSEGSLG